MSKKFYETAEFKDIYQEWTDKLAASGFEDIEKNEVSDSRCTPQLFESVKYRVTVAAVAVVLSKLEELEKWPSGEPKAHHKQILELYADGKTSREISKILKDNPDKRTHMGFQGVARVIQRYLKKVQA